MSIRTSFEGMKLILKISEFFHVLKKILHGNYLYNKYNKERNEKHIVLICFDARFVHQALIFFFFKIIFP